MSSLLMFWLNSWNWGVSEAGGAEGAVVRDVESELREEEKKRTERRRKGERERSRGRDGQEQRQAGWEGGREGGRQQEKVQDKGGRKGVGNKGRERGPIWSILALGVSHFVDPSEKERARKETGGRVGGGGVTDNILFNYCLNKNIVFLERKKPI